MQDYAFDRIKLSLPRRLLECSHRGLVTCLSAHADSRWTEIDIFSVVLVFETWGQKWLDSLERTAGTVNSYRSTIAYAAEAFGSKLVRKLGAGDVAAFNALLQNPISCAAV